MEELSEFLKHPALAYEEILPELASILPTGLSELEGFQDQLEKSLQAQRETFNNLLDSESAARANAEFDKLASQMLKQVKRSRSKTRKVFSLQKDWHVLHYALNGTSEAGPAPLEKSILGGTEFPIPADYGALRYLTPQEVREVNEALAGVDPQKLIERLDKKDADSKGIYLGHLMDEPDEWTYLPELFDDFKSFYQDAAKKGNAVLLKII